MALTIKGNGGKKSGLKGGTDYSQHLDEKIISKPVIGKVETQKTHMGKPIGEPMQEEQVLHKGLTIPLDRLCQVQVSGTHTVNLGNYESAKIHVGLTMPADREDINESYEFAVGWVSERIKDAIDDAKN